MLFGNISCFSSSVPCLVPVVVKSPGCVAGSVLVENVKHVLGGKFGYIFIVL